MKNRHILTAVIAIFLTVCNSLAGNRERKAIQGFSGGMMVHTGYLSGCDNPFGYDLSGSTFGIGGVGKVHLGKHFRTGFEGYFSNMGLKKSIGDGSYNKVFWAGALADWLLAFNNDGINRPMGPRIYFGFIFSH